MASRTFCKSLRLDHLFSQIFVRFLPIPQSTHENLKDCRGFAGGAEKLSPRDGG
jgi:hypothetical protein